MPNFVNVLALRFGHFAEAILLNQHIKRFAMQHIQHGEFALTTAAGFHRRLIHTAPLFSEHSPVSLKTIFVAPAGKVTHDTASPVNDRPKRIEHHGFNGRVK